MAGQDLTAFDAVLKDVYEGDIREQLNMVDILGDFLEEDDSHDWTGRRVTFPIHVGRNEGVGTVPEGSPLPTAGRQSYATVIIPERFNYGRIALTIQVIKSSQSNKGSFARAMGTEISGLVRDLNNERERQAFGNGKGILALVNGAQNFSTTTWLTVDSPFGVTPTTNGARFLNPNMTIAIIHPTVDATVEGTMTISSIGSTGNNVVLSATQNVTVSDNARIVRANLADTTGATNNLNNERMGMLGIIDDGTYVNTLHNVNRTTYPIFKAPVYGSTGQLSLDRIQQGCDASDELGGGSFGTDGVFFTHHSVRREYLKLLQADRRYTGGDLRGPDGGTKKAALKKGGEITYGDRPWKIAKHAPYGTLFGFLKGSLTRYVHVKGEWADEDGKILRNIQGYDKWDAFYRIFDNIHSDRPNDGFRLDGITATVNINHIY